MKKNGWFITVGLIALMAIIFGPFLIDQSDRQRQRVSVSELSSHPPGLVGQKVRLHGYLCEVYASNAGMVQVSPAVKSSVEAPFVGTVSFEVYPEDVRYGRGFLLLNQAPGHILVTEGPYGSRVQPVANFPAAVLQNKLVDVYWDSVDWIKEQRLESVNVVVVPSSPGKILSKYCGYLGEMELVGEVRASLLGPGHYGVLVYDKDIQPLNPNVRLR